MNTRSYQLMGNLPPIQFPQIRPFENTGLYSAGPLTTKCAHKRNVTKFKAYICLFICAKALHLELVWDLSIAVFLAALRRFIARRSHPSKILSPIMDLILKALRVIRESSWSFVLLADTTFSKEYWVGLSFLHKPHILEINGIRPSKVPNNYL
ncbi:integrase catalytic domain-containing protein [Trichonephila inaurata madagascariensis]|uniref:Integrase catalytic domain-containing protein n=1 Tax=Trichonephila inaurata madagascariensis TaxID=2747483 RepID=A0A8X6YH03_9ARAC|nr:integrase catalytic domain-containing protein [Trichonephila inaurata madagascariensis]